MEKSTKEIDFVAKTVGDGLLKLEDRSDSEQILVRTEVDKIWTRWWQSFLRGAVLPSDRNAPVFRCVDLFCGAGGLALGTSLAVRSQNNQAFFERIVDTDANALEVFSRNLNTGSYINAGVSSLVDYSVRRRKGSASFTYVPEIVDEDFALSTGADLLIAGPPCQGHSNLNNHTRGNDPRNDLLICAVATAVALNVKAAVFENVKTIKAQKSGVRQIACDLLRLSGYIIYERVLKATALGWPQTRERYFLIAIRDDSSKNCIPSFSSFNTQTKMPVLWAIGDLQDNELPGSRFDSAPTPGIDNQRRIDWLFDSDQYDLANSERPDCHREGTTYTSVYGRMHPDRPAPTITTGIGTPGQGRFLHPIKRRLITPHEAARIQGFPDNFVFTDITGCTTRKSLAKWIGDAVPPPLGFEVISWVLIAMGHKVPSPSLLRVIEDENLASRNFGEVLC